MFNLNKSASLGIDSTGFGMNRENRFGKKGNGSVIITKTIDLLSQDVDPLIKYECNSTHMYFDPTGNLRSAAINVWPLEYDYGVAVGRHEPEPKAKNMQPYSRVTELSKFIEVSGDFEFRVTNESDPNATQVALADKGYNVFFISHDVNGVKVVPDTEYIFPNYWRRLSFGFNSSKRSRIRIVLASSSTGQLRATQDPDYGKWPDAGDYSVSWFIKSQSAKDFLVRHVQLEKGLLATSPIVNVTTEREREASSVTVSTSGYSKLEIHFSNGDIEFHDTPEDEFKIPFASKHWGERYMSKIILKKL